MSVVWYIRPKPGITSETIGRLVGDEDTCYEVRCADGRKRNLYRVPWALVQAALDRGEPLRFTVWKQHGTTGPKPFDVEKVFRGRPDPKVRAVREQLGAQLARKAAQK